MENVLSLAQSVLSITPDRWLELAKNMPDELINHPGAPGEWSARDCLQHLVDTERMVFPMRVRFLLRQEDFPAFNPDAQPAPPPLSLADLALEFQELRSESLNLIAGILPEELDNTARHAELGPVTLGQLIHEWAAHDLMHTVQAERALMQPFIEGVGPWQPYFQDHIPDEKA